MSSFLDFFKLAISNIAKLGANLLKNKLLAYYFGPVGVGLYSYLQNVIDLKAQILLFGIDKSIVKAFSGSDKIKININSLLFFELFIILSLLILASVFNQFLASEKLDLFTIVFNSFLLINQFLILGLLTLLRKVNAISMLNTVAPSMAVIMMFIVTVCMPESTVVLLFNVAILTSFLMFFIVFIQKILLTDEVGFTKNNKLINKELLVTGQTFWFSGMLFVAVELITRSLLIEKFGLDFNGLYQSAWTLGLLVVTILTSSIGVTFYNDICRNINNKAKVRELTISNQVLLSSLALPVVVFLIHYGQIVLKILYSREFEPAYIYLNFIIIGSILKIFGNPYNYLMVSRGFSRFYMLSQVLYFSFYLCGFLFIIFNGLNNEIGLHYAFSYFLLIIFQLSYLVKKDGFEYHKNSIYLFLSTITFVAFNFFINKGSAILSSVCIITSLVPVILLLLRRKKNVLL